MAARGASAPPPDLARLALACARHHVPALRWARLVRPSQHFGHDVLAAVAALVVAVPEAVAFSAIAGVPAQSGLFSTLLAPIAYSALGSSPFVAVGPTSIMSFLSYASMPDTWGGNELEPDTPDFAVVASLLAVVVGLLLLVMYLTRAGIAMRFVGEPVLLGFIASAALLVASTQFAGLLGLRPCVAPAGGGCSFVDAASNVSANAAGVQPGPPLASALCLAVLLAFKYGLPMALPAQSPWRALSFAGPLVVVVAAIAISSEAGAWLKAIGIERVNPVPAGLPSPRALQAGRGTASDFAHLVGAALPVAFIAYIELIGVGVAATRSYGGRGAPLPDPKQELFALGTLNVIVGLAQGYVVAASVSRTAIFGSSARTPIASFLTGLVLVPLLLWAAPLLSMLPKVVTASIVMAVVIRLLSVPEFLKLWRTDKIDFFVSAVTFVGVLAVDVEAGFMLGVATQWLIALARRTGETSVVRVLRWARRADVDADAAGAAGYSSVVVHDLLRSLEHVHDAPDAPATGRVAGALAAGWTVVELREASSIGVPAVSGSGAIAGSAAARARRVRMLNVLSPVSPLVETPLAVAEGIAGAGIDEAAVVRVNPLLSREDEPDAPAAPGTGGRADSVSADLVLLRPPAAEVLFHTSAFLVAHVREAVACFGRDNVGGVGVGGCEHDVLVVVDCSAVVVADSAGAETIHALADELLQRPGGAPLGIICSGGTSGALRAVLLRHHEAHNLHGAHASKAGTQVASAGAKGPTAAVAVGESLLLFESAAAAHAWALGECAPTLDGQDVVVAGAWAAAPARAARSEGATIRVPASELTRMLEVARHSREPLLRAALRRAAPPERRRSGLAGAAAGVAEAWAALGEQRAMLREGDP